VGLGGVIGQIQVLQRAALLGRVSEEGATEAQRGGQQAGHEAVAAHMHTRGPAMC
jgi:hypothetical protein